MKFKASFYFGALLVSAIAIASPHEAWDCIGVDTFYKGTIKMVLTRNSGQSDENSRRLFRADVKFHAPILGSSQYTLDLLDQEGNCYSLTGYSPQVSYEIYPVGDFYESIGKMGITAQCEAEVTAVIAAYCKKRDL